MNLTAVYIQDGPWIVAWVEEIPGVQTQGATLEEARANLRDALALMLEELRTEAERTLADQIVIERELLPLTA